MEQDHRGFYALQELGNFEICAITDSVDYNNSAEYSKLPLDAAQVNMLQQYIPQLAMAQFLIYNAGLLNELSKKQLFTLKFPDGIEPTVKSLLQYKDGGFDTTTFINKTFGKHAHLFQENLSELKDLSILENVSSLTTTVFSIISMATGQYFLADINSKLDKINRSVNDILSFLYGDKKAELLSEIEFIKYAQRCYSSIMQHEEQRIATIASIQNAKKIAVKDIEFYLIDLENAVCSGDTITHNGIQISKMVQVKRIVSSLELALQLYTICCILEVYYSQNFDKDYLKFVIETASQYVDTYQNRIRQTAMKLTSKTNAFQTVKGSSFDLKQRQESIEQMLKSLPSGKRAIRKQLEEALFARFKKSEFLLTSDGELYYAVEQTGG